MEDPCAEAGVWIVFFIIIVVGLVFPIVVVILIVGLIVIELGVIINRIGSASCLGPRIDQNIGPMVRRETRRPVPPNDDPHDPHRERQQHEQHQHEQHR